LELAALRQAGVITDNEHRERKVDLIAMSTHGHRFFNDLLRGTTVNKVRHVVKIPVLLLRRAWRRWGTKQEAS